MNGGGERQAGVLFLSSVSLNTLQAGRHIGIDRVERNQSNGSLSLRSRSTNEIECRNIRVREILRKRRECAVIF